MAFLFLILAIFFGVCWAYDLFTYLQKGMTLRLGIDIVFDIVMFLFGFVMFLSKTGF